MACFHPLTAYRDHQGQIRFDEKNNGEPLTIPCGQCIGCRLERSRQWAMRCIHEAQMHGTENCFITLTYNQENVPPDGSLRKRDFQTFMKRLRKQTKKKFDITTVVNMATKADHTIMPLSLATTSPIGSIYSTLLAVNLYTQVRLSRKYGKKAS